MREPNSPVSGQFVPGSFRVGENLKIKVRPEDFIVRERVTLTFSPEGPYRIYVLEKRFWNTTDALRLIAEKNRVPLSEIGYGGRKDRYGLTFQHISVPRIYELNLEEPNVKLTFLGYSGDFVSPEVLEGNDFELTLRDIDPSQEGYLERRLEEISRWGFPNYFDDQRFGSVECPDEFFAERLIKNHYKGALKLYFTAIFPGYKKAEKERRRKMEECFGNWDEVERLSRTSTERMIARILKEGGSKRNLVRAINAIPKEELSMFFAAYQSYLWNKTLERILPRYARDLIGVRGKIMTYYFYRRLGEKEFSYLSGLKIPVVAQHLEPAPPEVRNVIEEVLEERGIRPNQFNLRDIRKVYFKSFLRRAIVVPGEFRRGPFKDDELYPGKRKLELGFFLPAGSFATMLVKSLALFARAEGGEDS